MVRGTLGGLLTPFAVGGSHERTLVLLPVLLLARMVGGPFIGVLVLLCLAFEAVKGRPNSLLARGVAGGNVEELLGGSRDLMS